MHVVDRLSALLNAVNESSIAVPLAGDTLLIVWPCEPVCSDIPRPWLGTLTETDQTFPTHDCWLPVVNAWQKRHQNCDVGNPPKIVDLRPVCRMWHRLWWAPPWKLRPKDSTDIYLQWFCISTCTVIRHCCKGISSHSLRDRKTFGVIFFQVEPSRRHRKIFHFRTNGQVAVREWLVRRFLDRVCIHSPTSCFSLRKRRSRTGIHYEQTCSGEWIVAWELTLGLTSRLVIHSFVTIIYTRNTNMWDR